jgi:hypothetical protein
LKRTKLDDGISLEEKQDLMIEKILALRKETDTFKRPLLNGAGAK